MRCEAIRFDWMIVFRRDLRTLEPWDTPRPQKLTDLVEKDYSIHSSRPQISAATSWVPQPDGEDEFGWLAKGRYSNFATVKAKTNYYHLLLAYLPPLTVWQELIVFSDCSDDATEILFEGLCPRRTEESEVRRIAEGKIVLLFLCVVPVLHSRKHSFTSTSTYRGILSMIRCRVTNLFEFC